MNLKTDTYFCADYYRKEKSKMTADKINTFDVLIEIQE
jgi:hypothetical protein